MCYVTISHSAGNAFYVKDDIIARKNVVKTVYFSNKFETSVYPSEFKRIKIIIQTSRHQSSLKALLAALQDVLRCLVQ